MHTFFWKFSSSIIYMYNELVYCLWRVKKVHYSIHKEANMACVIVLWDAIYDREFTRKKTRSIKGSIKIHFLFYSLLASEPSIYKETPCTNLNSQDHCSNAPINPWLLQVIGKWGCATEWGCIFITPEELLECMGSHIFRILGIRKFR